MKLSGVLAATAILGVVGTASASNLYTPPFWAGGPGDVSICKLYNVSTTPKTVQVQLINASTGGVLQDTGSMVLNPASMVEVTDNTGGHDTVCHFVGSKSSVRASGTYAPGPSFNDAFVVPAQ